MQQIFLAKALTPEDIFFVDVSTWNQDLEKGLRPSLARSTDNQDSEAPFWKRLFDQ